MTATLMCWFAAGFVPSAINSDRTLNRFLRGVCKAVVLVGIVGLYVINSDQPFTYFLLGTMTGLAAGSIVSWQRRRLALPQDAACSGHR